MLAGERYGRRADIWSLGALVIETTTGEPPWTDLVAQARAPVFFLTLCDDCALGYAK